MNLILKIYKSHIRSIIEYAYSVWNPYYIKDIELLERLQRKVTRIPPELSGMPYEIRLRRMRLTTLHERRHRGDLIEVFKIMNGYYRCDLNIFVHSSGVQLRGHSKKLEKEKCSKLVRKNFLSNRAVYTWNALREDTVSAPSLNCFKNRLDRDLGAISAAFLHYPA